MLLVNTVVKNRKGTGRGHHGVLVFYFLSVMLAFADSKVVLTLLHSVLLFRLLVTYYLVCFEEKSDMLSRPSEHPPVRGECQNV